MENYVSYLLNTYNKGIQARQQDIDSDRHLEDLISRYNNKVQNAIGYLSGMGNLGREILLDPTIVGYTFKKGKEVQIKNWESLVYGISSYPATISELDALDSLWNRAQVPIEHGNLKPGLNSRVNFLIGSGRADEIHFSDGPSVLRPRIPRLAHFV